MDFRQPPRIARWSRGLAGLLGWAAGLVVMAGAQAQQQPLRIMPPAVGVWSNNILVQLERSPEFGTRAFMTEAEHANALAELLKRNQRPGRDSREGTGT